MLGALLGAGLLASSTASAQEQPAPESASSSSQGWPQQTGYIAERPAPGSFTVDLEGSSTDDAADKKTAPREKKEKSFAFDLAAVTEVPVMIGGQATLELPYRFLVQAEGGVLAAPYLDTIDNILVGAGAYDANVSAVVRGALENAPVFRLNAGWRPFTDLGLELYGGYTVITGGTSVSSSTAVSEFTNYASFAAAVPNVEVPIHSTIHCLQATVAWRFVIAEHFLLRLSAGYMQSVGSSSHVDLPTGITSTAQVQTVLSTVNQIVDTRLNDIYTTYVKIPVIGASMGYRF